MKSPGSMRKTRAGWPILFVDAAGAQLAEFAVALPLLAVLLMGIYDFGNALSVKQKLTNAAREGARFIANTPMLDYYPAPVTPPQEAAQVVGSLLLASNLSDCGLSTAPPVAAGTLNWTYTATCPAGTLTLTVNRGATYVMPGPVTIEGTQVAISYPYQWQFNNVIAILIPGANYPSNTLITTSTEMANLN